MAEWMARPKDLPLMSPTKRAPRPPSASFRGRLPPIFNAANNLRLQQNAAKELDASAVSGRYGRPFPQRRDRLDLSNPPVGATMPTAAAQRRTANIPQTGEAARLAIRNGEWDGPTSGMAPGYVQGNLAILPAKLASDF